MIDYDLVSQRIKMSTHLTRAVGTVISVEYEATFDWQEPIDTNAWYFIMSANPGSDKVFDIVNASTGNGARLQQWYYKGSNQHNQHFKFIDVGGGYYNMIARHSGRAVDVIGAGTGDGVGIQQWDNQNLPQQQWTLNSVGGGLFEIFAKHSSKLIDVTGASNNNGVLLQQWTDLNGANQRWHVHKIGNLGSTADLASTTAFVIIDGASQAVQVKDFTNVRPLEDDRVGLIKIDGDWIVVGKYGTEWAESSGAQGIYTSSQYNGGAWVDLAGPLDISFTKRYDTTRVRLGAAHAGYSLNGTGSVDMWMGLKVFNSEFSVSYPICRKWFATANERHAFSGFRNIVGIPAGIYTVRATWARAGGTGTMTVDGTDAYNMEAEEVGPGEGLDG